jgi:hypothetical protein
MLFSDKYFSRSEHAGESCVTFGVFVLQQAQAQKI